MFHTVSELTRQLLKGSRLAEHRINAAWKDLRSGVPGLQEVAARRLFDHVRSNPAEGAVSFSDGWAMVYSRPLNADLLFSGVIGNCFTLPVDGERFGLHLTRHDYSGIISIESGEAKSLQVDLSGPWQNDDATLLVVSGLGSGRHRVTIRIVGSNPDSFGAECILRSVFLPPASLTEAIGQPYAYDTRNLTSVPGLENILNLHARKDSNVGDLLSAPARHFGFLSEATYGDLHDWNPRFNPSREDRTAFCNALEDKDVILGGGGLLETDYFTSALDFIRFSTKRNLILWGAGHNSPDKASWRADFDCYNFSAASFRLIGVRDYNTRFMWVPCASCLSPELDVTYEIKRPFGFFMHAVVRDTIDALRQQEPLAAILDNFSSPEDTFRFIGESDCIVTNSFHGAYWATLMKRRVVAIPTSSKFFSLKHPVPLVALQDWKTALGKTRLYPEALNECRAANTAFAKNVLDILK